MLEFAIVGSMFLTVIFAAIELGLLWWTQNALETTAAMTARCAALGACTDPTAYAKSAAGNMVVGDILTNGTVTVSTSSNCYASSTSYTGYTKVAISAPYWNNTLIGPFSGMTLSVSACYVNPT